METITLTNPIDMHIHLRQDSLLKAVLPYSAKPFSALLAMPNLTPPLMDTKSILAYKQAILHESEKIEIDNNTSHFMPIIALYVHDDLEISDLREAVNNNIKILKLYPKGATTNSNNGVSDILSKKLLTLLEEAQKLNMILSIHGESAGFSMLREREFLEIFITLATSFPNLKIIIEHLSDRHSIEAIQQYKNLFGTITLHHMLLTLDDILGGKLNPFAFCKPILKTPADRDAILEIALSGNYKFSFGSDSAPHTMQAKYNGAAGIFSAPILLEGLCSLFAKHNKIENLQNFVSENAQRIYGIDLAFKKQITLIRQPLQFGNTIQSELGDIPVFLGDQILDYRISSINIL